MSDGLDAIRRVRTAALAADPDITGILIEALPAIVRTARRYQVSRDWKSLAELGGLMLEIASARDIDPGAVVDNHPDVALAILGRHLFDLARELGPVDDARRIVTERATTARAALAIIAEGDLVSATALRQQLRLRGRDSKQSNVGRIVKRLVGDGLVNADRAPDGTAWYGITMRGRQVAEEIARGSSTADTERRRGRPLVVSSLRDVDIFGPVNVHGVPVDI